MRCGFRERLIA